MHRPYYLVVRDGIQLKEMSIKPLIVERGSSPIAEDNRQGRTDEELLDHDGSNSRVRGPK
jgi:hypothetical protein